MTTVRVPASTSNLGAGFDCLGLALDLWLEAELVEGNLPPVYRGTLQGLDHDRDIVSGILREHLPNGSRLVLSSTIPVSRGLGSSAAAVVAGLTLQHLIEGQTPSRDAIFRRGVELEGHPDNVAAAVYGGLTLATPRPTVLALHESLGIALTVPNITVDTRRARAMLPNQVTRQTAVAQARRAAALIQGLVTGNGQLIAYGMEDVLAVPFRKQLIRGFEPAVRAGLEAGAFGVTISGSGSALVAIGPARLSADIADALTEGLGSAGSAAYPLTPAVTLEGFSFTP